MCARVDVLAMRVPTRLLQHRDELDIARAGLRLVRAQARRCGGPTPGQVPIDLRSAPADSPRVVVGAIVGTIFGATGA